jgi:hypothetical protein
MFDWHEKTEIYVFIYKSLSKISQLLLNIFMVITKSYDITDNWERWYAHEEML